MVADTSVAVLVRQASGGDQGAWNALVDRYASLVWSVCRRFRLSDADAHDVSQTVWLRAVEHLPSLHEPAALPGWLATITRRECLRVRSAPTRIPWSLEQLMLDPAADEDSTALDGELLAAEARAVLREAFATLPDHCRRLLSLLVEREGMPYAEVSARLGIPHGSIGPTRSRCLGKLRDCPVLVAWLRAQSLQEQGGGRHA